MTKVYKEEVLTLGGYTFHVQHKDVKRLSLRLKPDGALYVSVPLGVTKSALRSFLQNNLEWVRVKMQQMQERQQNGTQSYDMSFPFDGSSFYLWGRKLQAVFEERAGKDGVRLEAGRAIFYSRRVLHASAREAYVKAFCEMQLTDAAVKFMAAYEARMGVRHTALRIRLMKSRWGSCNVRTGAITLNLLLACYPPQGLEYIVVHELAHLIEANHSPRFHAVVGRHLPEWKARKQMLREWKPLL